MTPAQLSALYARAFPNLRAWTAAEIDRMLTSPGTHLTTDPHGFAIARSVGDEAEILTIATDPDHQGQGIGTSVLTQLLDTLCGQGVTTTFLEVAADNAPARALYAKAGFTQTGLRRGYYRQGDGTRIDALILLRTLDRALPAPPSPTSESG